MNFITFKHLVQKNNTRTSVLLWIIKTDCFQDSCKNSMQALSVQLTRETELPKSKVRRKPSCLTVWTKVKYKNKETALSVRWRRCKDGLENLSRMASYVIFTIGKNSKKSLFALTCILRCQILQKYRVSSKISQTPTQCSHFAF